MATARTPRFPTYLYTIEQMRRLEAEADAAGHSYAEMMERAGRAVAQHVMQSLAPQRERALKVLVLAGPGNNGGDGLVAARHLAQGGHKVAALLAGRPLPDALADGARDAGVTVTTAAERAPAILAQVDVVIDALFGTGLSRPIESVAAELLTHLAHARQKRDFYLVGVDGPSGLHGDTGKVDPTTVAADATITFAGVKQGMSTPGGAEITGRLIVADIGIPAAVTARVESLAEWLTVESAVQLLPARPAHGHKGTFGTVLVVGGSMYYVGAPALAALAAGRSGAGLVTLAVPALIYPMLGARPDLTSATWLPLAHDFGAVRKEAAGAVQETFEKVSALVIGPGLGTEETTREFVYALLGMSDSAPPKGSVGFVGWRDATAPTPIAPPPTVIDADALNALAAYPGEWWQASEERARAFVLTPHPGELGRLLKRDTADIQATRLESACEAAQRFGQVVVLKGAHTVIAAPDGRLAVNASATSALARAGSGDVLSGVIGALLAQGLAPFDAARLSVAAHGRAGELLAQAVGARGALASDLIEQIARVWQEIEG